MSRLSTAAVNRTNEHMGILLYLDGRFFPTLNKISLASFTKEGPAITRGEHGRALPHLIHPRPSLNET